MLTQCQAGVGTRSATTTTTQIGVLARMRPDQPQVPRLVFIVIFITRLQLSVCGSIAAVAPWVSLESACCSCVGVWSLVCIGRCLTMSIILTNCWPDWRWRPMTASTSRQRVFRQLPHRYPSSFPSPPPALHCATTRWVIAGNDRPLPTGCNACNLVLVTVCWCLTSATVRLYAFIHGSVSCIGRLAACCDEK